MTTSSSVGTSSIMASSLQSSLATSGAVSPPSAAASIMNDLISRSTPESSASFIFEPEDSFQNRILNQQNYNLKKIATNLSTIFFNQAYRDGFFHADVHPGNLFVDKKHRIIMIDFGIMGRLDQHTRIYVSEILRGFIKKD